MADGCAELKDQTFQAVGKQVEQLALNESILDDEFHGHLVPTEVIDSLCMNCEKDVCQCPWLTNASTDESLLF
jgi:hypothetical protein